VQRQCTTRARVSRCIPHVHHLRPDPAEPFMNARRGIVRGGSGFVGDSLLKPMSATQFPDSSATGDATGTVSLQQICSGAGNKSPAGKLAREISAKRLNAIGTNGLLMDPRRPEQLGLLQDSPSDAQSGITKLSRGAGRSPVRCERQRAPLLQATHHPKNPPNAGRERSERPEVAGFV